jgi:hypothetical protein
MDDLSWTFHSKTGPFLHRCSINVLFCMLARDGQLRVPFPGTELTSNVIHEIGSFSGIAVLLISFNVNSSSLNSKVRMAPGGVQVPTIK